MKIAGILIAIVALLGVGIWTMNRSQTPATNTNTASTKNPTVRPVGTAATDGKKVVAEVTVVGKDFSFEPKELKVKEGDVVTLTFKNEGKMDHDFVIEGAGIATKVIDGGATDVIQFTAPKAGTYDTFCSVGTHRQMGMVGKLIVE